MLIKTDLRLLDDEMSSAYLKTTVFQKMRQLKFYHHLDKFIKIRREKFHFLKANAHAYIK